VDEVVSDDYSNTLLSLRAVGLEVLFHLDSIRFASNPPLSELWTLGGQMIVSISTAVPEMFQFYIQRLKKSKICAEADPNSYPVVTSSLTMLSGQYLGSLTFLLEKSPQNKEWGVWSRLLEVIESEGIYSHSVSQVLSNVLLHASHTLQILSCNGICLECWLFTFD
jgi:hypothetical protein